ISARLSNGTRMVGLGVEATTNPLGHESVRPRHRHAHIVSAWTSSSGRADCGRADWKRSHHSVVGRRTTLWLVCANSQGHEQCEARLGLWSLGGERTLAEAVVNSRLYAERYSVLRAIDTTEV